MKNQAFASCATNPELLFEQMVEGSYTDRVTTPTTRSC